MTWLLSVPSTRQLTASSYSTSKAMVTLRTVQAKLATVLMLKQGH